MRGSLLLMATIALSAPTDRRVGSSSHSRHVRRSSATASDADREGQTMTVTRRSPRAITVPDNVVVIEHGIRGAGLHVRLRGVLVVFALATVLWEPPEYYAAVCQILAVGYLLWAVAVAAWFRRAPAQMVSFSWLVLGVDLLLFGALNQLAGVSNRISWTAY